MPSNADIDHRSFGGVAETALFAADVSPEERIAILLKEREMLMQEKKDLELLVENLKERNYVLEEENISLRSEVPGVVELSSEDEDNEAREENHSKRNGLWGGILKHTSSRISLRKSKLSDSETFQNRAQSSLDLGSDQNYRLDMDIKWEILKKEREIVEREKSDLEFLVQSQRQKLNFLKEENQRFLSLLGVITQEIEFTMFASTETKNNDHLELDFSQRKGSETEDSLNVSDSEKEEENSTPSKPGRTSSFFQDFTPRQNSETKDNSSSSLDKGGGKESRSGHQPRRRSSLFRKKMTTEDMKVRGDDSE